VTAVSNAWRAATPEGDAHHLAGPQRTLPDAVDEAVAGHTAGWDEIVAHLYDIVHRYCLARLGDVSAAEEVTQDVFVASTRSLSGLRTRNETAIRAWFLRIARFKVADRIRQRRPASIASPFHIPAAEDPEQLVVSRLRSAELRAALEELTEAQREVLIRRFVLDESLEDVARTTRRPVGAVKSLQHRALKALAKRLRAEGRG
jgi:RNA polymerase sigma-70 factor (ECF subfamily)